MATKRVTEQDIILINEAYLGCKTYSGAAAATGWSAATVKKYVDPNYKSQQKVNDEPIWLPLISDITPQLSIHYDLTCLSDEEEQEIKTLWKELVI